MKRNAIIIAGIMLVSASVAAQDYGRAGSPETGDAHTALRYDPEYNAGRLFPVDRFRDEDRVPEFLSDKDISADSSGRGGSLEAQDLTELQGVETEVEGVAEPIDPSVQADSSIRGGYRVTRGEDANGSPFWTIERNGTMKADSSIRGGSLEARGWDRRWLNDGKDSDAYHLYRGSPAGSVEGSANWNSSDDLMKDDMDQTTIGRKFDLNTSDQIEANITGEYDLNKQSESEASGSAATSESGKGSSEMDCHSEGSRDFHLNPDLSSSKENELKWLFKDNRAHGVGSLATSEFGTATSDDHLEQSVKAKLSRESTGTFGLTADQARNIHVDALDGTVILRGTVSTEQQRQLAEIRVREMAGVRRVDNQLTVSPQADPAVRDFNSNLDSSQNLEYSTEQNPD